MVFAHSKFTSYVPQKNIKKSIFVCVSVCARFLYENNMLIFFILFLLNLGLFTVRTKCILLTTLCFSAGWVLTWLKGHDMNVYCMRWYPGEESPLMEDIPINSRAEAMMEGSGKGPESRNKANSKDFNVNVGLTTLLPITIHCNSWKILADEFSTSVW